MTNTDRPGDELAGDLLGFGRRELVTTRDLLLRPRIVLKAWMEAGAEGGGSYARPLRLYLGLNAILMLMLFLRGGAGFMLEGLPPAIMSSLMEQSGKSRDGFIADADGWMTLVMVPVLSLFYALAAAPLLRLWDKEDLGRRRGFRAAFGWLCAWTVPMLPLAWWAYGTGPVAFAVSIATFSIGIISFVRMGRGRWFKSPFVGVIRGILLLLAVQISAGIGGLVVGAVGILGGLASA